MKRFARSFFLLAIIAGGCSAQSTLTTGPSPSPSTPQISPQQSPLPTGPCPKSTGGRKDVHMDLRDVRLATDNSPGKDSITFEFSKSEGSPSAVPYYEVDEISPPLKKDPSDQPMEVEGSVFVRVLFWGASEVVLSSSGVNYTYKGSNELKPHYTVLREAELQGDFEATLSWILGLDHQSCWTVKESSDPVSVRVELPH